MELILIIGTTGAVCAVLTLLMVLAGIVIVEWLPDHVRRLKAWIRGFKPRRRLPTGGPLMAA